MKILDISFIEPSLTSGGGIGIRQSLLSLAACGEVDYIGPAFEKGIFPPNTISKCYLLEYQPTVKSRIMGLLKGVSSGFYDAYQNVTKNIDWSQYDVIQIEFSKYPMLVKQAKKSGKKVLIRVHNVEREYCINQWKTDPSFSNLLYLLLNWNKETYCFKHADVSVFLTKEDREQAINKYGCDESKAVIVPMCVDDKQVEIPKTRRKNILITGSLWYGPNYSGTKWFLQEVWPVFCKKSRFANQVTLTLAGAKPKEDMIQLAKQFDNIIIVPNPESMDTYFENAYVCIAPIFTGAGMKVKIAEAMMHGVPIIAASHTLIGYQYDRTSSYRADTAEEYLEALEEILNLDQDTYYELCEKQKKCFANGYKTEISCQLYKKLLASNK